MALTFDHVPTWLHDTVPHLVHDTVPNWMHDHVTGTFDSVYAHLDEDLARLDPPE